MLRLVLTLGAVMALTIPAAAMAATRPHQGSFHAAQLEKQGYTCTLVADDPTPNQANGNGSYDGPFYSCTLTTGETAAPSSSFMCRILDAREPVVAVPDEEILSTSAGSRSLANGWQSAAYDHGRFVCEPVTAPTAWTDDSLSMYDEPNTAYANPVAQ